MDDWLLSPPSTIWSKVNEEDGRLVVVTAIDNLVKGASGQAVQNMNIMLGFPEAMGLDVLPLTP
jgi:N-acetyl-gamma-glutamyl-phosphate reductase